jgi:predicted nuclease of predicted toxin-antitoxin system
VVAVAEMTPRADDETVLALAQQQQRILLTEDKDFGQLVYADQQATSGVVLIRYPAGVRSKLPGHVVRLVSEHGSNLAGRFTVIQPGRIRLGARKGTS